VTKRLRGRNFCVDAASQAVLATLIGVERFRDLDDGPVGA